MQSIRICGALATLLVGACTTQEVLQPKSAVAPFGVDFSGNWTLRSDSAADRERINAAIGQAAGSSDIIPMPTEKSRSSGSHGRSPSRGSRGGLVQVFLESGDNIKVTQTDHGIFVSFDRSVVVEYRFGETRTVNVGAIVAQRASGWEGDRYVVETLDRNGTKMTETIYLSDNMQTLHRLIVIRKSDGSDIRLQQSFARQESSP